MVTAIGLDIVEIDRIEKDLSRYGRRFAGRILGAAELSVFDKRTDQALYLAGRFAAKEAVVKCLGYYVKQRPALSDIEILNDPSGRPELHLPAEIDSAIHGARCLISITHERNNAAAVAVFEENQ